MAPGTKSLGQMSCLLTLLDSDNLRPLPSAYIYMAAIPPSGAKWPLIDASPDNSPAIYGWEYHNSNFKVPPGWAEQLWPSARILRTSSRVQLLDRRNRSAAVPGCGCRRRLAASSITGRDGRPTRRRDAVATQ